jgi:hypothetical protein
VPVEWLKLESGIQTVQAMAAHEMVQEDGNRGKQLVSEIKSYFRLQAITSN